MNIRKYDEFVYAKVQKMNRKNVDEWKYVFYNSTTTLDNIGVLISKSERMKVCDINNLIKYEHRQLL